MTLSSKDIKWLYLNSIYTPSIKYYIDDHREDFVYVKKILARDFTAFPIGKDVVFVLGADISQPTGINDLLILGFLVKKTDKTNSNAVITFTSMSEYKLMGEYFQTLIYNQYADFVEVINPPELEYLPQIIKDEDVDNDTESFDFRKYDD